MASPELEQKLQTPEEPVVREIPETPEIPVEVERDLGIKTTQTQPKSLQDASGQRVVQAVPDVDKVPISIPADPVQAVAWSRGEIEDQSTWLGVFILRKLKQALALGRKVIVKK